MELGQFFFTVSHYLSYCIRRDEKSWFGKLNRNISDEKYPQQVCFCGNTKFEIFYFEGKVRFLFIGDDGFTKQVELKVHEDSWTTQPGPEMKRPIEKLTGRRIQL